MIIPGIFVQIQLNYLDWQSTRVQSSCIVSWKDATCRSWSWSRCAAAIWRPSTASVPNHFELEPQRSIASWAIRWVESLPQVAVVLSGMSDLQQLEDNVATMTHFEPMNEQELAAIDRVVEEIRKVNEIPCTGCRYCMDCPMVDIRRFSPSTPSTRFFGKGESVCSGL